MRQTKEITEEACIKPDQSDPCGGQARKGLSFHSVQYPAVEDDGPDCSK